MEEFYVTSSAMISCSFGTNPCPLMANPSRTVSLSGKPKLSISDFAPGVNVSTFGMCSSPSNPAVIAATAAAMGVLTPQPCMPVITTPWMPGKPDMMIQGMPALTNNCTNMCMWAGQISFNNHGQIPMPPPLTTPPFGSLSKVPSGDRAMLTEEEQGQLPDESRQQYQSDLAQAQQAGHTEEMLGQSWAKVAGDYAKRGESGKSLFAVQKSQAAFGISADKRNTAIGDVNQRYRKMSQSSTTNPQ